MQIIIQPPNAAHAGQADLGRELRKAIDVLRSAHIPTDGGGSVGYNGDMFGALFLRYKHDSRRALRVLTKAGVRAFATQAESINGKASGGSKIGIGPIAKSL